MSEEAKRRTLQENTDAAPAELVSDIRRLVEETRGAMSVALNAALTMLHWKTGTRINEDLLQRERATYGKQILQTLSAELTGAHGRGWSERNTGQQLSPH